MLINFIINFICYNYIIIISLSLGFPVDWWSMGVILYEMIMGVTPFMSSTIQDLFEEITNGKGHVIITWPIVTWQQLRVYYYFKVLDFWSLHLPLSPSLPPYRKPCNIIPRRRWNTRRGSRSRPSVDVFWPNVSSWFHRKGRRGRCKVTPILQQHRLDAATEN